MPDDLQQPPALPYPNSVTTDGLGLRPGWLQRQMDYAAADITTWPAWMRREAGKENA